MSALNPQIPLQPSANQIIHNYITVETAAEITGYNIQYLRRLLRSGKLTGTKVGQVWLIKLSALELYFQERESCFDRRCGPKSTVTDETFSFVNAPCIQTYTEKDKEE